MGCAVANLLYKRNFDNNITTEYSSLLDIPAIDIDGKNIERLSDLL